MKQFLGVVLLALIAIASAEQARFDNYRVYTIHIGNEKQLEILKEFDVYPDGYELWDYPTSVGQDIQMVVPPHKFGEFPELMEKFEFKNKIFMNNLQEKIDAVQPKEMPTGFSFEAYQTLEEVYAWMDEIVAEHSDVSEVVIGGSTFEGREIRGVKISHKAGNPGVFIEAGIHAREWIALATATYLINDLLTSTHPDVQYIAENYDWYIFPSCNPDGYVHTHDGNRMWRKTRSPSGVLCTGTDPNRNWDFMWMQGGASSNPCSQTFAGPEPFSEIEVRSLVTYYSTLENVTTYLSFHAFTQLLLVPFGYTPDHLKNYEHLMIIGEKAVEALTARHGTEYRLGNIAETIYVASGSSIDFIRAVADTPLAYCYEFRDLGENGFLLPADQIIPNGEEVVDSIVALLAGGHELGYH